MLGSLHIVIGGLYEPQKNVFDILADISRFGQRGRIRNCKRNIERLCKRLRKVGFADAGRSYEKDVALCKLHIVVRVLFLRFLCGIVVQKPLVVIVNRDRQRDFRFVLPDHILVKRCFDLGGYGKGIAVKRKVRRLLLSVVGNDLIARFYAVVADVCPRRRRNEKIHLILAASAEGAAAFSYAFVFGHIYSVSPTHMIRCVGIVWNC